MSILCSLCAAEVVDGKGFGCGVVSCDRHLDQGSGRHVYLGPVENRYFGYLEMKRGTHYMFECLTVNRCSQHRLFSSLAPEDVAGHERTW